MATPEAKVKTAIKAFLATLPNCWWFMPGANGYGTHGVPDIIVCYRGFFLAIEVKKPGNVKGTTPLQDLQIRKINDALGYAVVADNVETVQVAVRHLDACHKALAA